MWHSTCLQHPAVPFVPMQRNHASLTIFSRALRGSCLHHAAKCFSSRALSGQTQWQPTRFTCVRHICGPGDALDLLQRLQLWRQPSMHTQDLHCTMQICSASCHVATCCLPKLLACKQHYCKQQHIRRYCIVFASPEPARGGQVRPAHRIAWLVSVCLCPLSQRSCFSHWLFQAPASPSRPPGLQLAGS